jgi:hypothetical protein
LSRPAEGGVTEGYYQLKVLIKASRQVSFRRMVKENQVDHGYIGRKRNEVHRHCQVAPRSGRPKKPKYDVDANLASCSRASKCPTGRTLAPSVQYSCTKHKTLAQSYLSCHRADSVSPWPHRLILGRSSASLTAQVAPPHAMRTELQYIYIPARRNLRLHCTGWCTTHPG